MSRISTIGLTVARNAAILAAVALSGYDAYVYVVRFGNLDPFSNLKKGDDALGPSTGLRLAAVDMREYRNGKLVAAARLDKVDISKDRTSFDLFGVRDGVYYGRDKIQFSADQGNFNTGTQRMAVFGTVKAKAKDFDLRTGSANFDRRNEAMQVPLKLNGQLYGGTFEATSLTYDMQTGDAKTGPIKWKGKPPAQAMEGVGQQVTPRIWSIDGHGFRRHLAIDYWNQGKATDGEVLVIAPMVQHDVKTDVLTATGRVTYFSGKSDLIADQVVVYRKEKKAVFTGNVVMLVKPKKDQDQPPKEETIPGVKSEAPDVKVSEDTKTITEEDKKRDEELRSGKTWKNYPLNIKAETITYWYGKGSRHAIIQGEPVANQDFADGRWRKGWAHDAAYDGELDTLQLNSRSGNKDARMKNSIGDSWLGSMIKMSTKEDQSDDDSDIDGTDVSGIFVERSGEDDRGAKKGTDSKPTTPPQNPPGTPTTQPQQPATVPTKPGPGGGGG